MDQAAPPLDGIRVLDFGRYIAGPYCAALLADYGAEVIRVDKRGGSEDRFVTPVTPDGEGAMFLQMNRNKRSITLDPMSEEGREVVRRLVLSADVVVANLPTETLTAMGLSYDRLSALKPDIILTTVSAFGNAGPWRDRVGFDSVGQVMSGGAYLSGGPDGPSRAQTPWVDFATALHCAYGTMVALLARRDTGRGRHVQGALLETAVALTGSALIEQAVLELDRKPQGNQSAGAAPVNIFATTDGWITCHVVGQPLYQRWARLMGETTWTTDPRFATDALRGDNRAEIDARMQAWCAERTRDEALEALGAARIPCGPVLTPRETLAHEQVLATGVLQPVAVAGLAQAVPIPRAPLLLSDAPAAMRPAPAIGADTEAVLQGLGYGAADIARMAAAKVI